MEAQIASRKSLRQPTKFLPIREAFRCMEWFNNWGKAGTIESVWPRMEIVPKGRTNEDVEGAREY